VARTVALYERAGVAALHIEDQEWPKRCGFLEGKRVIPVEEMELKVRAAVAARRDPATVIIARTDALAPLGREEAAERARRYAAAGADLLFIDGLKDRETIAWAAEELRGLPLVLNTWLLTPGEAAALGFRLYLHLGVMLRHFEEFRRALWELQETGRVALGEDAGVEWVTALLDRGVANDASG
jgi:2-methylisocitrate lyase-like PEP mutase family enzyme